MTPSVHPVNTQTWVNGRHLVRCVKVIQETSDVRTFCFMAEQPVMFFFKPGQFVTLELEIDSRPVMRSYTISSSPLASLQLFNHHQAGSWRSGF